MDIFDCWIYIMKNMNMFEQMPFSEKYPVFRKLAEIGALRKRPDRRQLVHEPRKVRDHRAHARLLQHDLRHPGAVRRHRLAPRQRALVRVVPQEKRRRQFLEIFPVFLRIKD